MTGSRRFSGLLLVAFLALAVVPMALATGNSQIALRASNAYRAAMARRSIRANRVSGSFRSRSITFAPWRGST